MRIPPKFRCRAPVGIQVETGGSLFPGLQIGENIRAAKAVDGLFRIPDEKKRAAVGFLEASRDLAHDAQVEGGRHRRAGRRGLGALDCPHVSRISL